MKILFKCNEIINVGLLGMSEASSVEEILHQTERLEKDYDWLVAGDSYEKALKLLPEEDLSRRGEIHERLAYARFRAAFQAESSSDFQERMHQSVEEYEKASEILAQIVPARGLYCKAMARYSDYWSVEDASQKKRSLDDCWRLLEEALDAFAAAGDGLGYGKAFVGLAFCLSARGSFEESLHESKEIVEEAVSYGRKAVTSLSMAGSVEELAWAYIMTSRFMISSLVWNFFEERKPEFLSSISEYLKKARGLRDRIEDVYFQFFLDLTLSNYEYEHINVRGDLKAASKSGHNLLLHAQRARDHRLLAKAYQVLNEEAGDAEIAEEDPDKKREQCYLAIKYAEESVRQYLLIHHCAGVSEVYAIYLIESHYSLAELEASVEEKRLLLKRALEVGRKGNEYAQLSGSLGTSKEIYHVLSKTLHSLSKAEMNVVEKRRLLGEALELREKYIEILSKLVPPDIWVQGIGQNYLALIKTDLAEMEQSEEQKRRLLEEAVSSMEKCIAACTRYLEAVVVEPSLWRFVALGWYHDWFGEVLDRLYSLTKDERIIDKAIRVSQGAVQVYQKAGMPSRVAEAHWRAARLHDQLCEYVKSAEDFDSASRNYELVAEKIPQLRQFYQDYSLYMQAWCEIQKARNHHAKQDYGLAKEHYEKAAAIHKTLQQWAYLAPNYSAWAHVEGAEDLSRREQSQEALDAFEQAIGLFTETHESLQTEFSKIENLDERTMVTKLVKATDIRREYCIGRMALEHAKILDRKGDHYSSSEKYGMAAATFEKIVSALEREQDEKEFRLILTLSRAWQKMTQAEAETSPALYKDAAQLFEEARELSPNERARTLALGHSRFCKALEVGTNFVDTRDSAERAIAVQHLESAANYYIKAGCETASDYARATKQLFDAYVYMDSAERETDPDKKARLYAMTEKVLQTSADSYMKAEYLEKGEQVSRLVKKVKEERELALSLSEVLHAPSIASATTAFTTPNPNYENAVGLERFEHADIQAKVIVQQKILRVDEELALEIELTNAGKGSAQLIRLAEFIPQGFELAEKPEIYRVEDSDLDMKGKWLNPLKTEEFRLLLRPKNKGVFQLKPKVLYLDENGKHRSKEPEPIEITVKELGIKGWLKGER